MIIMENVIQFIENDLGASKALNNIKSTDKIMLNKFLNTYRNDRYQFINSSFEWSEIWGSLQHNNFTC